MSSIWDDGYGEDDAEIEGPQHILPKAPPKPPQFSSNPIVRAVESYVWRKRLRISLRRREPPDTTDTEGFMNDVFDVELQQQLGKLLLAALMDGDKRIVKTVAEALKKIDRVFNRDREKDIADKVWKYVYSLPNPWPPNNELRQLVERRFCTKNKKWFDDYQWRRLSKMLLLAPQKIGRPKKQAPKA